MERLQDQPASPGREKTQPGRENHRGELTSHCELDTRPESRHGAHDQGAFLAEIDPSAFFGDRFAETDEQERRAGANAPATTPRAPPKCRMSAYAGTPLRWKILKRP